MSFGSNVPLCPVCRARMTQAIPGTRGVWSCPSHGNFMAGSRGATAAAVQSQGTAGSFAPGDTLSAPGVEPEPPGMHVTHTKARTAAVNAGGTGGTPGAATLTGTTGTGTKFQATGTINGGGALAGALTVSVAGDYTVNPSDLTAEPVTGGGLTGCTLAITTGMLTIAVDDPGVAIDPPANPVAVTGGGGSGATVNLTYGAGNATDGAAVQDAAEAASGAAGPNILTVGL